MTDPQKPFQRLDYQASIDRPLLTLPEGKRVAAFLVVNVERWDMASRPGTVFWQGRQIMDWYRGATA